MNFYRTLKLFFFFAFLNVNLFSFAQFTVYNESNSGLPYNTVRCVCVNPFTNDVWAGTDFGLAKFDGTNWTVFNTLNSGLTDNQIRAVETDDAGNIWAGTLSAGLFKFDGSVWINYNMTNSDLPDNQIKDIEFDQDGYMWVATTGGLAMYDGNNWTIRNVYNSSLPTNNISSVKIASDNSKRVGAVNGGLQIISADNSSMQTYWSYNSFLIDNTILMIDFDAFGYLWMATPSGGLIMHAGGDNWVFYNTETSDIPTNSATYIFIDNNKKYIPTIDDGLLIYDGISFINYHSGNSGLPDNYLYCIEKDNNGTMWMGSYNGGLISFNPQTLSVPENLSVSLEILNAYVSNQNVFINLSENATRFEVYDLQGKLIEQNNVNSDAIIFPAENLKGMFVFVLENNEGKKRTLKLFIP